MPSIKDKCSLSFGSSRLCQSRDEWDSTTPPRAALPRGTVQPNSIEHTLREIKTRAASGKCRPAPQAGYFVPSTIIVSRQQKSYGMRWKCPSTLFSASCSLLLISQRRPSAKRMMNAIPMLPTSPAKHFALPFGRKLKMLKISTPRMATNKYDGKTKRAGPKTYPISSNIFPRCRAKWKHALRGMNRDQRRRQFEGTIYDGFRNVSSPSWRKCQKSQGYQISPHGQHPSRIQRTLPA